MRTVGERVKRLREERGLSVLELASSVGCSEATIRQLESGHVQAPSFVLGVRLANALNADPAFLALGEGQSFSERFDLLDRRLRAVERELAERRRR
jgi:transcriptional regulator with XRE-family HTH domain